MARGNHTGKGGFQSRPQDRNKGSIPKDLREKYNSFRSMVLDWANNPKSFKKWAKTNPTEAYKLAGNLMPKDISFGDDENITSLSITWKR